MIKKLVNSTLKNWHRAQMKVFKSEILTHLKLKKQKLQEIMNHINKNIKLYTNNGV